MLVLAKHFIFVACLLVRSFVSLEVKSFLRKRVGEIKMENVQTQWGKNNWNEASKRYSSMSMTRKLPLVQAQSLFACLRLVIGCLSSPSPPTAARELRKNKEITFTIKRVITYQEKNHFWVFSEQQKKHTVKGKRPSNLKLSLLSYIANDVNWSVSPLNYLHPWNAAPRGVRLYQKFESLWSAVRVDLCIAGLPEMTGIARKLSLKSAKENEK